jgi:hypothetical protein
MVNSYGEFFITLLGQVRCNPRSHGVGVPVGVGVGVGVAPTLPAEHAA